MSFAPIFWTYRRRALIIPGLKVQNWILTSREHLAWLASGLNSELVSSKVQVFISVACFGPSYHHVSSISHTLSFLCSCTVALSLLHYCQSCSWQEPTISCKQEEKGGVPLTPPFPPKKKEKTKLFFPLVQFLPLSFVVKLISIFEQAVAQYKIVSTTPDL